MVVLSPGQWLLGRRELTTMTTTTARKPREGETLVRAIRPNWDFLVIRWTDGVNYPHTLSNLARWSADAGGWVFGDYVPRAVHPSIARAIAAWEEAHECFACRDAAGRAMYSDGAGGLLHSWRLALEAANSVEARNRAAWREFLAPLATLDLR